MRRGSAAAVALNGKEIDGREVMVSYYQPPPKREMSLSHADRAVSVSVHGVGSRIQYIGGNCATVIEDAGNAWKTDGGPYAKKAKEGVTWEWVEASTTLVAPAPAESH